MKRPKRSLLLNEESGVKNTVAGSMKPVAGEMWNSRNCHCPSCDSAISLVRISISALPFGLARHGVATAEAIGEGLQRLVVRLRRKRQCLQRSERSSAQLESQLSSFAGNRYSKITVNCIGLPLASNTP